MALTTTENIVPIPFLNLFAWILKHRKNIVFIEMNMHACMQASNGWAREMDVSEVEKFNKST